MTPQQAIDVAKTVSTIHNNAECFNKLRDFFNAMLCGQHTDISDEEIHKGMDYVKEGMKTTLKNIKTIKDMEYARETDIDLFCDKIEQSFIKYNQLSK